MYNFKKHSCKRYTEAISQYGQLVKSTITENIFIDIHTNSQTNVNNPLFAESTYIGVAYHTVPVGAIIDDKYKVTYCKDEGRLKTIYMVDYNGT